MGEAVHVNVCPECGTADSGHGFDPPPHCKHERGRFEPQLYIPLNDPALRELVEAVRLYLNYAAKFNNPHRRLPDAFAALTERYPSLSSPKTGAGK